VLDLPHAVEAARREADKRGLSVRFSAVVGDFFESVPTAAMCAVQRERIDAQLSGTGGGSEHSVGEGRPSADRPDLRVDGSPNWAPACRRRITAEEGAS
jgi:hypothetical protein